MAKRRESGDGDTRSQILDAAERLAQVRGFNAFSYADVAAELKITNAALHWHFASKSDLGEALIPVPLRHLDFADALQTVESQVTDAAGRLDAYANLYTGVLRDERMCLCGMLAAEYPTLPAPMQRTVVRFFSENEAWLTRVLELGREPGKPAVRWIARRRCPVDRQHARGRHAGRHVPLETSPDSKQRLRVSLPRLDERNLGGRHPRTSWGARSASCAELVGQPGLGRRRAGCQ